MMHFKWISIAAVALALSACSGTGKRPPQPEAGKPAAVAAPQPAAAARAEPAEETEEEDLVQASGSEGAGEPPQDSPRPDPDSNIFFPSGGTQVDGPGKAVLARHAERLKQSPDLVITLVGHTDPVGSRSYNLAIAEHRIDSVVRILRSLGVPRGQIRRVSSGRVTMDNRCRSAACRRLMRRVELILPNQP